MWLSAPDRLCAVAQKLHLVWSGEIRSTRKGNFIFRPGSADVWHSELCLKKVFPNPAVGWGHSPGNKGDLKTLMVFTPCDSNKAQKAFHELSHNCCFAEGGGIFPSQGCCTNIADASTNISPAGPPLREILGQNNSKEGSAAAWGALIFDTAQCREGSSGKKGSQKLKLQARQIYTPVVI